MAMSENAKRELGRLIRFAVLRHGGRAPAYIPGEIVKAYAERFKEAENPDTRDVGRELSAAVAAGETEEIEQYIGGLLGLC
jgi:hypothetical protein